jgi:tetraacyldisaccharide 4'-kinase
MHDLILRAWQQKNVFFYLVLIPLSWLFAVVIAIRRWAYKVGLLQSFALPVPVVVVGNINMGGSGKTPVVIWLVEQLKKQGYTPGVISRGYGVDNALPTSVRQHSLAAQVGDEPLLIAKRTDCPVWVGKNRVDAGKALLNAHPECDVIISDDGLQHYRLQRSLEIAVIDRDSVGEQSLLPAGPLREPQSRLNTVDVVIANGEKLIENAYEMQLHGQAFYNLINPVQSVTADYFNNKKVKALAGIGKPVRFFNTLTNLGLDFEEVSFEDHYAFTAQDLAPIDCEALLMTEKDAVKCQSFAKAHYWVLPVDAKMDAACLPLLLTKLKAVKKLSVVTKE